MKNLIGIAVISLAWIAPSLVSAGAIAEMEPSQQFVHTSIAGHTFTLVTDHSELANAWKDEGGLIWGSVVRKTTMTQADSQKYCWNKTEGNFSVCRMTQRLAVEYCHSIGAELPTQDQFVQLDEYLGDSSTTMDINGHFLYGRERTEAIPDLAHYSYWSATLNPGLPNLAAKVFSYGSDAALQIHAHDVIDDYITGGSSLTRCVTR